MGIRYLYSLFGITLFNATAHLSICPGSILVYCDLKFPITIDLHIEMLNCIIYLLSIHPYCYMLRSCVCWKCNFSRVHRILVYVSLSYILFYRLLFMNCMMDWQKSMKHLNCKLFVYAIVILVTFMLYIGLLVLITNKLHMKC